LEQIIIKGLKIFAYHGCNEEEKINGQDFFIDAVLKVKSNWTSQSDLLENTVNYASVIKFITKEATENRYNLIESLAARLCEEILKTFKDVKKITVTVKKPNAPMKSKFLYVAVKKSVKRK